ncbi:hypothetical protein H5410_045365, partial [Solanum commersonii]
MADLVELDMIVESSSQVAVSSESVIELKSSLTVPKGRFILYLKVRSVEIPHIQSISLVRKFPEVFLDDFL